MRKASFVLSSLLVIGTLEQGCESKPSGGTTADGPGIKLDGSTGDLPDMAAGLDAPVCPPNTACTTYYMGQRGCVTVHRPAGFACYDEDRCTTDDACDGNGLCTGRMICSKCPGALLKSGWCWYSPLPQGHDLYGVWSDRASNMYAVGFRGTLLHHDGSSWTIQESGTDGSLTDIWGPGGKELFAVGDGAILVRQGGSTWKTIKTSGDVWSGVWGTSGTNVYAVGSKVLRYDGSAWRPEPCQLRYILSDVWGAGATDIYAVGRSEYQHFDGTSWNPIWINTPLNARSIWGSGPNSIYLIGSDARTFTPEVYYYDGSALRKIIEPGSTARDIWGGGATDVFIALDASTPDVGPAIAHYDGSTWKKTVLDRGGRVNAIHGSSSTSVYAVGNHGYTGYYDGTSWRSLSSRVDKCCSRIWGTGSTDIFGVSEDGIYHYDGRSWSIQLSEPPDWSPEDVWGSSPSSVWAVGKEILHYDGRSWKLQFKKADKYFIGVWGSGRSDVWAVGLHATLTTAWGIVYHFNGNSWNESWTIKKGDSYPYAVWGASSSDVFAVGAEGLVAHYDGTSWKVQASGTTLDLWGVWGTRGTDVFAVGSPTLGGGGGGVLHYDGTSWKKQATFKDVSLDAVWGSSATDVYAVGRMYFPRKYLSYCGAIIHYDGVSWKPVDLCISPVLSDLSWSNDVWGSSSTDVFFVSYGGIILHYMNN